MPINDSREKFEHELADIYDAEHQFLEAQDMMLMNATDQKVKSLIEQHMEETREQIENLEKVFSTIDKEPQRLTCSGAKGIVEEGSKAMEEAGTPEIRDEMIVTGATKAEHYEMVAYSDLIQGAQKLKNRQAVRLLTANRDQEVRTARKLERVAPRLSRLAA